MDSMLYHIIRSSGLLLIVLLLSISFLNAQNQFHVSPDGDDLNSGTETNPFATLERARDAVRSVRLKEDVREDVIVWIHEGVYTQLAPLEFDARDSGTRQSRTIFRAAPGESVRIIGGRILPIETAQKVTDPAVLSRWDNPLAGQEIVVFDLRSLGIEDFGQLVQYGHGQPVRPAGLELFINRDAMTLARYPNEGSILIGPVLDSGSIPRTGDYSNRGGTFTFTDDRHERWASLDDVWFQGTFMWGYADDMIPVERIDPVARQVKLKNPHMYGIGTGAAYRQYIARNILDELDEPGEWYLDRISGLLFVWPPVPLVDAEIAVSILEDPVVVLENVSRFSLEEVTIEFGRGMGVYMEGGEENLIAGCTLRNLGTIGIMMGQGAEQTVPGIRHDGYEGRPVSRQIGSLATHLYHHTTWNRNAGFRHTIRSNDVYNTGAGGIYLSGGDKATLTPGESLAENNRTWRNQRRNKFLWSGIIVDGVGNRVANNEVFDSDYQGIMVRGGEHIFEYNHVHDIATDSDDTSPWYTGRDPSDRGNIVRYNYFHDVGRPDRMVMGIYLDDGTSGTTVHGNVIRKVASYGSVYSNSGSDNAITNNIFIDGFGPAFHLKSMWFSWAQGHIPTYWDEGGIYRHRLLEEVNIHEPPYSTRYPELADFFDLLPDGKTYRGMIPSRNVFARNLVVRYDEVLRLDHPNIELDVTDNYYTSSVDDFVDYESGDFSLKPNAEVFQKIPGFERIPFAKMGIYRDPYRTRQEAPEMFNHQ